jgi:hypothetical protein
VRPVAHGPDIPQKTLGTTPADSKCHVIDCDDVDFQPETFSEPQLFTQCECSDSV